MRHPCPTPLPPAFTKSQEPVLRCHLAPSRQGLGLLWASRPRSLIPARFCDLPPSGADDAFS
jgi:hypothetical protein